MHGFKLFLWRFVTDVCHIGRSMILRLKRDAKLQTNYENAKQNET